MPTTQKVDSISVSEKKPANKSRKPKRKSCVISIWPSKNGRLEIVIHIELPSASTSIIANPDFKPIREFMQDAAAYLDSEKYHGKISVVIKGGIHALLLVKMLHAVHGKGYLLLGSFEDLVVELINQYRA